MRRKLGKFCCESTWEKDGNKCHIRSKKDFVYGGIDPITERKGEFTFSGYNPFPCFSMVSTYGVISEWLKANGWKRLPGGHTMATFDIIDKETGEVIDTYANETYFVPVKEGR